MLNLHHSPVAAKASLRKCATLLCAMALVLALSTDWAKALYVLTDEDGSVIVLDEGADASDFSSKLVYVGSAQVGGFELTLTAGQSVTVDYQGARLAAVTKEETISALLDRLGTIPGPTDIVAVDLSGEGVALTVASELTFREQRTQADPAAAVVIDDPTLPFGTEKVIQEGADGVCDAVYEVVYAQGARVSRTLVSKEDSTAIDRIVAKGTAAATVEKSDRIKTINKNADGSGTLVFESGASLAFSAAKSVTATAYTTGYDGVGTITATGTRVKVGSVAVDKRVIPLGSKLYIVSNDGIVYGMSKAEDTGVKGSAVDLYMNTYDECINFGRRGATAYVLEP